MTEVSSWSPTDASNNLTPPDGWPEGMQPSGVNDVGRMMMGAIRRWYNTVSAGIASCMPISGGTFTGPISAPGIFSSGNLNVSGTAIMSQATVSGNLAVSGTMHSSQATVDGILTVGTVNASVAITAPTITAPTITAATQLTSNGNATISGTLHSSQENIDGNLTVGNNATISGAVHASQATVDGSLTANNAVNTNTYQLGGQTFATHGSDAAGPVQSIFDIDGVPAINMYGASGTYYRCDNAHSFTNRGATLTLARFQATDGVCQNATGSWSVLSDASAKENLVEYTAGLAEVLQLNPQSFTYIPDKTKFATEGRIFYGLVAQEVEPVLPEMVSADDETGIATLAPTHLVYVLINAVKELEARLAQVENRGG